MFKSKHQDINGRDVLVIDGGDKSKTPKATLILVHGIGVSSAYFKPFFYAASKKYRAVAIDLPGYGTTEDPKKVLTIKDLADIVNQLVEINDYHNPILVGHSMGTQIVAHAVNRQPNLYKKYILLAPTINRHERNIFLQAFRLFQDTLKEPFKVNAIIFRDYLRMGIWRYLVTAHFMIEDSIEDVIRKNHQKMLIVNGLNDPICPNDWAHGLANVNPNGQFEDINGSHVFQYQQPNELLKICQKFIES